MKYNLLLAELIVEKTQNSNKSLGVSESQDSTKQTANWLERFFAFISNNQVA
jgi:hypothetical protein